MVFIVLAILGILVYISVMYYKHIELKYKKKQRTTNLKYKCPSCGSDIEVLKRTDYNMYFSCSNPSCFNHGWGSADISYMTLYAQTHAKVIQERVPNPDNIKDWDLKSAKDVEFTKVTESFNRKSDLD